LEEKKMKKIFIFLMVLALCMAVILPAGATEANPDTDESTEYLSGSESVTESVEDTAESHSVSDSEFISETESQTENIAAIIGDADSRLDAIVKIAAAMGITLDEAEALLDKMVALGDEHLADSDLWNDIRADILENPDRWIIVALVVLMLIALVTFIIRGLIKNTTAQAATRANIIDIKENEAKLSEKVNAAAKKLSSIGGEHVEIKAEMYELRELVEQMQHVVDASKDETARIHEMAITMLSAVERIKADSASALKVNEEQALQTVQLLNIAMGRKLPTVSQSTRKVWYEDAVSKIKEAANDNGTEAGKNDGE
jgi:uncharacterized protein YxeA